MGRPFKMGLDYFTVDTDLDSDPKIQNLIRKGDTDAWSVYSWLWIKTYHDNYYIEKDTLVQCLLWLFRDLTRERILECLDILVECKLINETLYEKGIITGKGIQKRYWEVAKKRSALPDMTYWLLTEGEFSDVKTPETRSFREGKPHGGDVSESESHEREREREKRKGKPASVPGGAAGSKKPPAGMPDPKCPVCKGTGWIISEDNEAHRCDCIRR